MTPIACAICVVICLGLNLDGSNPTRWGYLPDGVIWEGRPWALFTSVFVHREIWHLGFNLLWLWALGNLLEDEIGSWYWLLFFLGAAWVSSALQLLISGGMGIGMSGVGYALFGFGWVARSKMPRFQQVLTPQTINGFLIWLVGCVALTYLDALNVANVAHFAGMVFGMVVAGVFVVRWQLALSIPGLGLLLATSFLPLEWCPLSPSWTAHNARLALNAGRDQDAIYWYSQSLKRGARPVWVWSRLARLHESRGNIVELNRALRELRQALDAEAAEAAAAREPSGGQWRRRS